MNTTEAYAALNNLRGLKLVRAAHAADMREFGFGSPDAHGKADWWLHIQCSWRLESAESVITGSLDWHEPERSDSQIPDEWDPAHGGSLQDARLRATFADNDKSRLFLLNNTELLVVDSVHVDGYGDLSVELSGGFRIRAFPNGSTGEFWRIFKKNDLSSHYVCEAPGG